MNIQPAFHVESDDHAEPKPLFNKSAKFAVGLLALAGAALAFYFLIIQGGFLLAIGFLFEIISLIGPSQDQDGVGSMLLLPAVMVVGGLCLAFGLLDLAFRGLSGKPLPSRGSVLRFCLISAVLIVATVIAVSMLTWSMAG